MNQEAILAWFSQYAYQPVWVYSAVVLLMTASSFGLPLPEEVPLIAAGLVAYMARNPELYPPPAEFTGRVEMGTLAVVAFVAVLGSDYLVYSLGRYGSRHLHSVSWFKRFNDPQQMVRLKDWIQRHGKWACGLFRFTPGLRFPGFLACGALGIPPSQFLLIDGLAALLSVPTQVVLIAIYGETILKYFKDVKIVLAVTIAVLLVLYLMRRLLRAKV